MPSCDKKLGHMFSPTKVIIDYRVFLHYIETCLGLMFCSLNNDKGVTWVLIYMD